MSDDDAGNADQETFTQFKESFFYGRRSNLDFKFLARLSDDDAADFFAELLDHLAATIDDGDAQRLIESARRWQVRAYRPSPDEPNRFSYDGGPFTAVTRPLAQSRVAVISSSGHFVDGDDPEPFGVDRMTQAEAESRISDFLREPPNLSTIPVDTPADRLRVRHPGYPIRAAAADPEVVLPLGHLRRLAAEGRIGPLAPNAYSFVGATSQLRLRDHAAPRWAEQLRAEEVDLVLLVPV